MLVDRGPALELDAAGAVTSWELCCSSLHTCRYGSLSQQDGQKYRYHEYYLIEYDAVRDCFVEDRRVTLFHVMLPLSELQAYVPAKLARRGGRGTKK